MKLAVCLLIFGLIAVYAEPQFYQGNFPWANYFRSGNQADVAPADGEGRFFFATQYLTIATSTITSTSTITTSCTTSTAALSACVASGGRKRRDAALTSLFYNDDDAVESIFLPSTKVERAAEPAEVPKETPPTYVPFVVQPGFMSRSEPQFRFLVAFTTGTTTVTTTTTSITSLTAICSSTTNLQLCGSNGK